MRLVCRILLILSSASTAFAQDADVFHRSDSVFTASDSLSIFNLIDSILNVDNTSGSQLAVRLSYNSNVLSAGRTLGIENFGLSSSLSYYHTSGLYADVSGYWSKDFNPSYYLTIVSVGYMKDLSKNFSIMAGYDKYLYNLDTDYIPYANTLSITPVLDIKPISFSANYSFYFGKQYAHRIMPGISLILQKKKLLRLDRVAILPSFFLLMGNEQITEIEYIPPTTLREAVENFREFGTRFRVVEKTRNVFGVMNYMISMPISISYKQWSFMLTYAYNIPKALPGEPLILSNSSFLTGSISYLINLKRSSLAGR